MQIQGNTEMQFMRRARTVTQAVVRGTAITLTFLTRAILSSYAEAITIMVRVQACSISTTAMVLAAAVRSVRSWSHFNATLSLALCKSAENIKCHPMQITGSENEMEVSYKKSLALQDFF